MVKNFLFHRVHPVRDPLWDPMDVALFDRCISYISRHYQVVLIEDLIGNPTLLAQRNIATIMFDDGYKDNIEYAAPILDKYGCKASFYVVTDCIEHNIPTWTHILEHSFLSTKISNVNLMFEFIPLELRVTSLPTREARLDYVKKLKPILKKVPHEQRNMILRRVQDTYTDVAIPRLMMTWEDLSLLRSKGHYIGSHTVSHCVLGTMTDTEEIRQELRVSGQLIEQHLGYFPKTISYPVGSYDQTTIRLSQEVGYTIGLAVKQKPYEPEEDSVFEIPRIELYNESWFKTLMRITNLLEKAKKLIRY